MYKASKISKSAFKKANAIYNFKIVDEDPEVKFQKLKNALTT